MAKKILVKQIKSVIGVTPRQRSTMRALGLRKINATREHDDNAVTRGMINIVLHLVDVTEVK